MGSSYFYLEFLIAWISMLQHQGFKNPAIFALEYTLVPEARYPIQLQQMLHGFEWFYRRVEDSTRICLSGDSAGGTLCLSHLLHAHETAKYDVGRPAFALLLSPWTHLVSPLNRNTASDYLNAETLHIYGRQYSGTGQYAPGAKPISPGTLEDPQLWKQTAPRSGYGFVYGCQEVFAPNIDVVVRKVREAGVSCDSITEEAGVHAWPVVALFLGRNAAERLHGIRLMSELLKNKIPAGRFKDYKGGPKLERKLSFNQTIYTDDRDIKSLRG